MNVLKLKFAAITNASNSPTEYGSKIMEYVSELIFFGLIEFMHIFFASIPTCSEENFDNVLTHACPIPETGTLLCSDSALIFLKHMLLHY